MLKKLRVQLTLLYLLAGTILVAVMGGWLYYRMATYFQTTTDLALKYRLAMELRLLAAPISPELEEAEQDFLEQSKSEGFFPTPTASTTPSDDEDDEEELAATETPLPTPTSNSLSNPPSKPKPTSDDSGEDDEPEDEEEKEEEKEEEEENSNSESYITPSGSVKLARIVQITPSPSVTPIPETEGAHSEPDLDDIYFSEMTSMYVLNLDSGGTIIPALNQLQSPFSPDLEAIKSASQNGTDVRNVVQKNGTPFRLLTYRVPEGYPAKFIQVGRPIDEHARLLRQYLTDLVMISLILLILLGIGSWWLAGKTLLPTQKSLELQQAFVANASHELRTPLTLMRASTELASRSLPEGEPKKLLGDALSDVDYMSKMIEDLLLLSRLDHQRIKLDRVPVQVDILLQELENQSNLLLQGKGVQLELNTTPAVILADPDRLKQVLWILVDNAIHHSPAGSTITLESRVNSHQVEIAVQDNGSGISPEDIPHVFERFYRSQKSAPKSRGAGLGLSIAENLIKAHNGRITITSQVGKGTTATIILSLHQP